MRIPTWITAGCLFFFLQGRAQSSAGTLDIVSWNVEWFGSNTQGQGPPDKNLQEANIKTVLKGLNADLYGLLEVVDTLRLRRLRDSLGSQYEFVISPYCSGNNTGTGTSWLTGQKLAFIYNKQIFTNVRTRGLMRTSTNAYTNFASGRFPFLLSADVQLNGQNKPMNFILIHGKAGNTVADYTRRLDGAKELKDTLDAYFSNSTNIILGDFNDALNTTICSGCTTTISSYDPIIADSTDSDHYRSITLPLAYAGQSSMTNFPNVVDNHVISNEAAQWYIPQSTLIRTDVVNWVVFYANTTSDHYPVFSQYTWGFPTAVSSVENLSVRLSPNPFSNYLRIQHGYTTSPLLINIYNSTGVRTFAAHYAAAGGDIIIRIPPGWAPGIYFLEIRSGKKTYRTSLFRP